MGDNNYVIPSTCICSWDVGTPHYSSLERDLGEIMDKCYVIEGSDCIYGINWIERVTANEKSALDYIQSRLETEKKEAMEDYPDACKIEIEQHGLMGDGSVKDPHGTYHTLTLYFEEDGDTRAYTEYLFAFTILEIDYSST